MIAYMNASISLSVRLMLVGLPAWRKTEIQNLTLSNSVFLSFSSPCRQADQHQSNEVWSPYCHLHFWSCYLVLNFDRSTAKEALKNTQIDCHQWLSHTFRVQQIRFRLGLHPWPAGRAYSAAPDLLPSKEGERRGWREGTAPNANFWICIWVQIWGWMWGVPL